MRGNDAHVLFFALSCPRATQITNACVSSLPRSCPDLQVVVMEVLPCLDDSAVQDLVHGCPRLLSLDVGSCRRITNVAFQIIGEAREDDQETVGGGLCTAQCQWARRTGHAWAMAQTPV